MNTKLSNFDVYKGRRVLVTGHTGFKGSWLCEMLLLFGAEVHGYALNPPTNPSLFDQLRLVNRLATDTRGDVRDRQSLADCIRRVKPEFVFHLAAQPLVRESYFTPAETFETNVMGTVNVLEAVRTSSKRCTVVCITTDKVYENDNSGHAFCEGDPLGGCDPYSASKGACEIAIASYRRSFFSAPDSPVRVASARAGNVIGGGDWAADRIVPDVMRAFLGKEPLVVRNRHATRPWQHVLEPLVGYLSLGEWLDTTMRAEACSGEASGAAFNFGPDAACVKTVGDLVEALQGFFPNMKIEDRTDFAAPREAQQLQLDSTKARKILGWTPRWNFQETVCATAAWYRETCEGASPVELCHRQIEAFLSKR